MALSKRLSVLAALVPYGARVCDIGTDHAYLPIELARRGDIKSIIATDINEKPLENAKKSLAEAGVTSVSLRRGYGLGAVLQGEADTFIIAGMGGEVIAGILGASPLPTDNPPPLLILQPTTSPEVLRRFLCNGGFEITGETAVSENGHLYSVITAKYSGNVTPHSEAYYYYGELNPEQECAGLYIQKQYERLKKCADALSVSPELYEKHLYYKSLADELKLKLD